MLRSFPVLLALVCGACASSQPATEAPAEDLHTLPGRFAEEPVTQPLVATEAFIGTENFYLAYEGEEGVVYTGGNWSNRIDLTALSQGPDGDYEGPFILPLEYHQRNRWNEVPENPIVPRLLGSKYWGRFTSLLFESVLPKAEMTGIVMHFGEEDYFLYYHRQARKLHGCRKYRFHGVHPAIAAGYGRVPGPGRYRRATPRF
jgi:hypothetical protein